MTGRALAAVRAAAPAALITACSALCFTELFRGRYLFERDVYHLWYGQMEAIVRALASFSLPLWDPTASFGEPLIEVPAQALYPFTWLGALMSAPAYYSLAVVSHHAFGGAGMWLLLRTLDASPSARLVGAGLFLTSGAWLSVANMLNLFLGAAWLPWIVLGAERTARSLGARDAVLWGAAVAAGLLTCSEPVFMGGLLGAALFCVRVLPRRPERVRATAAAGLALATALVLSAAQWVPIYASLEATARAALPMAVRTYWSLDPLHLIQIAVPFFSADAPSIPTAVLDDFRFPLLRSVFLGPAATALAFVGAVRGGSPGPFLASALGLSLYLALGRHAPLFEALWPMAPLSGTLRFPAKWALLSAFLAAVLAARGFDQLEASGRKLARLVVALIAGGSLAFWLGADRLFGAALREGRPAFFTAEGLALPFGLLAACTIALSPRLPARARALAVALVAMAPPLAFNRAVNEFGPRSIYDETPLLVRAFRADGGQRHYFRAWDPATTPSADLNPILPDPSESATVWSARSARQAMEATTARVYGIRGSFEDDIRAAQTRDVRDFTRTFREAHGTAGELRLLRAAGVSHISTLDPRGAAEWTPLGGQRTYLGRSALLYRVPDPLPLCFVVDGIRTEGADPARELAGSRFALDRFIIASSLPPRESSGASVGTCDREPSGTNEVRARIRASRNAVVVFLDAWRHGWRAELDGRPAPVHRVNAVFRGVEISPGEHEIVMRYRPPLVLSALAVSAFGALAAAGFVALGVIAGRASRVSREASAERS